MTLALIQSAGDYTRPILICGLVCAASAILIAARIMRGENRPHRAPDVDLTLLELETRIHRAQLAFDAAPPKRRGTTKSALLRAQHDKRVYLEGVEA